MKKPPDERQASQRINERIRERARRHSAVSIADGRSDASRFMDQLIRGEQPPTRREEESDEN
jgi:hypothetical protein